MKYITEIEKTIDEQGDKSLSLNPSFAQKPSSIIGLVDHYWMSKYRDSQVDEFGNKKVFFNQIEPPTHGSAKSIDFKVSDFDIIPHYEGQIIKGLVFEDKLHQWLRINSYGKFFKELALNLPKYGTVVVKKIVRDGKTHLRTVPLQNLAVQADADSIKDAYFVVEKHFVTPAEFKKMPFDKNQIQEVLNKTEEPYMTLYEYYGELEADPERDYFVVAKTKNDEVVLKAENRERPYRDVHWDKIKGRWLGVGVVEKLFEAQIHLNKVGDMKEQGLHWTSKHLYQTTDRGVANNLMDETVNGDVLTVRDEIRPVVNEERNLAAYKEEEEQWYKSIRDRTFFSDIIQGSQPTSGVPLGSTVLASQMAQGYFSRVQDRLAIFLKELLYDWILPSFESEMDKEFIHRYVGANEEKQRLFDQAMVNARVNKKIREYVGKNGEFPSPSQLQLMNSVERKRMGNPDNRYVKVPKGWFKDLKYDLEIVITGEATDVSGKLQAIQTALQALSPQDTEKREQLINRMMSILNQPPLYPIKGADPEDVLMAQQQGSPPRPQPQNTPTPGANQQRQ